MVPKGKELVATLMFEIDNEVKRKEFLCSVGGIENQIFLEVDGEKFLQGPKRIQIEQVKMEKLLQFIFYTLIFQPIK